MTVCLKEIGREGETSGVISLSGLGAEALQGLGTEEALEASGREDQALEKEKPGMKGRKIDSDEEETEVFKTGDLGTDRVLFC